MKLVFKLALLVAAAFGPASTAQARVTTSIPQQVLIDQWSDSDYRLSCARPANTILYPAAQKDVEGSDGIITLMSSAYVGTVEGRHAPEGSLGVIQEYLNEQLDAIDGPGDFEFRVLPMGGEEAPGGLGELVQFLGEEAHCLRLLDERPGMETVREVRVIVRGETALHFFAAGRLPVVGEDARGFAPFFESFQLEEGDFKHRSNPPSALDFDGPGYRMRGGVLESGELGLRVEAPKGWRVASRGLAMDWSFASQAHFVAPGNAARITIGTATVSPGAAGDGDRAETLVFAGGEVEFEETFPSGRRGALQVLEGVFRGPKMRRPVADASIQLVMARDQKDEFEPIVHASLAGAKRLSGSKSAKILKATTGPNDPQVGFGEDAWLRGGTYYHGVHGLRWTPPSGVWTHLVEPAEQYGMDRDTLLMSFNHARNFIFELRAKKSNSKDLERAHRRGLAATYGVRRSDVKAVDVEEGEFLGHKAMRTRGRSLLGVGVLDFTTILMDGYAIHVSSTSIVDVTDEAAAALAEELVLIRDAVVADEPSSREIDSDTRYVNRQFGFTIDVGNEPWKLAEEEFIPGTDGVPVSPTVRCDREGGLGMWVTARWLDSAGASMNPVRRHHRWLFHYAQQLVGKGMTLRAAGTVQHQGQSVQVLRSGKGGREWESAYVQRGPILYTIVVWDTETEVPGPLLEKVLKHIEFE